ncbi:MAG: 16S rRNA (guanine(966)-N(2))-methyltransferase RsmD [Ruminococcaceae bacterium]|nr:16S rRNA (guanine(966)-N(2))-methyltransferase RsmD [Oscillospiraceae bacterium]
MMRIITGTARGTKLETLEGEATRPTSEKVKEAVFSMIQFDIEGRRCLDLFGGSGQMGLEALSRGAAYAVFADSNAEAVEIIKKNAAKTHLFSKCNIIKSDYKNTIRAYSKKEKFDIIFLDPPYALGLIPEVLKKLTEADIIADNAVIVCESEDDVEYGAEGLSLIKHVKYGRAYITLLTKLSKEEE